MDPNTKKIQLVKLSQFYYSHSKEKRKFKKPKSVDELKISITWRAKPIDIDIERGRETHITSLPNFVQPSGFIIRVHTVTKKKKNPEPRLEFLIKTTTEPSLITTPLSTPHYPMHISHQNPQKSSHKTKKIPIIWVHNACESELEVEKSRWEREREREKRLLDQKKNQLPLCLPKKLFIFVFSDRLYQQRKMLSFSLSLSLKTVFAISFLLNSFLPKRWQLWVGGRVFQFLADFTRVLDIYIFYYLILYDNKQCQMFNNIYIYILSSKNNILSKKCFFYYYFVTYATCIRVGLRNFTKRAVTANTYCWICLKCLCFSYLSSIFGIVFFVF